MSNEDEAVEITLTREDLETIISWGLAVKGEWTLWQEEIDLLDRLQGTLDRLRGALT